MRLKSVRSGLVLVTASAVAMGVLSAVTAAPAAAATGKAGTQQGAELSRPDAVSAAVAARVSGKRVLVTGLSTETSSTWVNPDGSFSTDTASVPVQAQVSPGVWRALDETLGAQSDGSVAPAVSVTGARFGKAGSAAAVRMGAGLDTAGLDWLAGLPAPAVSGSVATYPNVLPSTDLTATATATGFELSLVVKAKPVGSLPATLSLPLKGTGLTWSLNDSGVLLGADATGATVVTSSGAVAYDATQDEHTGQPLHSTPLGLSLTGAAGARKLNVTVPTALLNDPTTVFPVTIDPSTSWSKTAHTYVDSGFATTSYYNANVLLGVGTYNSGTNKNRTMFAFNTANILGKHVLSATINLNEAGSWNCTAQPFDLWSIGAFGSSTTWNTQPGVVTKWATITAAKGYSSSCPAGNITGDMTSWASAVAAGSSSTSYLELRAQSETDNNQWKKFNPASIVSLTYNSYPGQPVGRTVSPCGSPCGSPALTNTTTPALGAYTVDPDGQTLRYFYEVYAGTSPSPTTLVSSGSTAVAPGTSANWHPSGLVNGSTYEYRVRAFDGIDYGPWSSGYVAFTIDTSAPVAPVISSTTHASGVWTNTSTGSFSWTDSSTDRYQYSYSLDAAAWSAWSTGTSVTFTGLSNAYHSLLVKVSDHAGNVSPNGSYQFGAGTGSLSSPADQDRTQARVTLTTAGPSAYGYVAYQWRRGTTAAWANVPLSDLSTSAGGAGPSSYPTPVGASWVWNVVSTAGNNDGLIQARACLYLSVTDPSPVCQGSPTNVQLTVKTFGASYATAPVGPGTVSLATGDFSVSVPDVNVGSSVGSLGLSRTLTTLAPPGESAAATGVFGPGWTASLFGPQAGAADQTLTDQSANGYYLLTNASGSSSVYALTAAGAATYKGVGDADDGSVLTKIDSTHVSLTDTDGTVTTWVKPGSAWQVDTVVEPGSATTTTFTYTSGYVSRILGALPAGVTSCATPDTTPGCRSLILTYTTVAGHNRLTTVSLSAPVTAGVSAITPVQSYDYDSSGLLIGAYDPRITPHLETAYSYDSNGRLATVTPPGQAAWTMHYDSTGCASTPPATSCGRLTSVTRPDATLGQTATITLIYDLPTAGTGAPAGLDLSATTAGGWNQKTDLPLTGTGVAVFGPNDVPASPPSAADWHFAHVTYLDVNGRSVDSADYGAGDWQITSTRYDQNGNTIWALDAGNRAQALNPTGDTDPAVAAMPNTYDRADALATINTYNGDPAVFGGDQTVVTDTLGPQHPVQLAGGTIVSARAHTHTDYDQGAPGTGGPFRLPTTITNTMQDSAGAEHDPRITRIGYSKINSSDPNEADGWTLFQATTITTQMGATPSSADLVRTSRYNQFGQQIESRLPAAVAGASAGDTLATYYTATGTGACVSPAQAGLLCSVTPAAQPSSGNPLPVTTTTYDSYDQPLTVTETAGSTVRTTTNTYDTGERLTNSSIVVTPTAAGGTALPAVSLTYDSATGLTATQTAGSQTLTSSYDSLGRITNYTDATGNTATTNYDLSGRVSSINDGKGTATYFYDTTSEHRDLVTSETLGVGSAPGTFTATYNPAGQATTVTYPSGLTATSDYDNAGNNTNLTYAQAGTTWYEFTQTPGSDGNTAGQTSPASSQQFSYDQAGRLTQTKDTVPDPSTGVVSCATRAYSLDVNSNRTSLNSYPDDGSNPAAGNCTTATTPTTLNGSYDQADRLTNAGYSYDTLGRTTAVPAVDAQGIGSHAATTGALAIGYYSNDLVANQTQGGRTLGFTLDPLQDRIINTTDTAGPTTTDHYSDSSDSPAWISTATTWTRNLTGPTGGLAAIVDQTGTVTLELANMHGDIVDTAADDPAAAGGNGYSETTEFGAPRSPAAASDTYGWLGSQQRSTNDLGGLSLMGVRLYNPATGRFLSVDPVPGGNDNAYIYPANPVNRTDPSGKLDIGKYVDSWSWKYTSHSFLGVWLWSKLTISFKLTRKETHQLAHRMISWSFVLALIIGIIGFTPVPGADVIAYYLGAYFGYFVWALAQADYNDDCLTVAIYAGRSRGLPWGAVYQFGWSKGA